MGEFVPRPPQVCSWYTDNKDNIHVCSSCHFLLQEYLVPLAQPHINADQNSLPVQMNNAFLHTGDVTEIMIVGTIQMRMVVVSTW